MSAVTVVRARALVERQRVRAACRPAHRHELGTCRDLTGEPGPEAGRDLVVAAADVVLLVRLAEDPQLARPHVAEQVQEIQRALRRGLGAVLDVVGDVEQPAET